MNRRNYNHFDYFDYLKEEKKETGEILLDVSKNEKYENEKLYLVKYICSVKTKQDKYFVGRLQLQKQYSYIFKDVNIFRKLINHKTCKLTVQINWILLFDIEKLLKKIPLDIIIHEIIEYLYN